MRTDVVDAIKAAPPAGVMYAYAAGWTINDYAAAAALLYSVLLSAQLIYRWVQAWRAKRRK